ncbi:MAG: hypothetical protein H0U59_08715 [Gemmatimonadaceae bacterium]|nr:hypothetical protein [Gemmatimonadaceae bacterium]
MMILTIYLVSGLLITEPITRDDCSMLLSVASHVDATGQHLSRDEGLIAALTCDGRAVVLMLPASAGDCEMVG